jgi:hypothetical protein
MGGRTDIRDMEDLPALFGSCALSPAEITERVERVGVAARGTGRLLARPQVHVPVVVGCEEKRVAA